MRIPLPSKHAVLRSTPAVEEAVQRAATHGRASAEANLRTPVPSIPCTHCLGAGNYAETLGGDARRPFDAATFDRSNERYVATCPECSGFGRVFCTKERAARYALAEKSKARTEYKRIRRAVVRERGIAPADFDAMARRRVVGDDWVRAARVVADSLGVER